MEYFGLVALISLGLGVGIPLFYGRAREALWGLRKGPAETVGASPYRAGTTQRVHAKGAPWSFRFTAGANAFWGVLTVMLFAPAGLFILGAASRIPVAVFPILIVSLSGFGTGVALCVGARRLLRRESLDGVRRIARWSQIHHFSVLLAMALGSAEMETGVLFLMSVVPCFMGALLAHALMTSARNAEMTAYADELDDSPSFAAAAYS